MAYVELHARSAFSFLEGASVPEELIAAGLALELPDKRSKTQQSRHLLDPHPRA
jgi:hypothetical protein